jgi:ABC-2 type transport system permease protein
MTRTWEVFRFELGYQLGRVSTRIYFAIFLALSIAISWAFFLDARADGYFFNAPIIVSAITIITSMIALLVTAGLAGDAATRDAEARLDSLLYTTPLRKASYLGGRFLGVFVVMALLLVAVPLGLLLATRFPGIEQELLGPFRVEAYLTSYLFFALPNAFVATAVLFAMSAISRRAIAAYGGAAFLFFTAFLSEGFFGDQLGQWQLGRLVDPLGFVTLRSFWRTLNPLQKNTTLISLDGQLLTNRLLWLGLALTVLAIAFTRFRFAHHPSGAGLWPAFGRADDQRQAEGLHYTVTVPRARRVFGAATRLRQLLVITRRSFREIVTGRGWLIVPFVALIFVLTSAEMLEVELGTPGAATTARIAEWFSAGETLLLITLLIALSAGELVWRERDARMAAIADVTPVPEWLSYLGKFLALALTLALAQLIFIGAGVGVQLTQGFHRFEPLLYVKILLGIQLFGYLLTAAVAMFIHELVNQKYVGHVLVVLTLIGTEMLGELDIEHNLLLFGGAPGWSHTDMGGFGLQLGPWLWFNLYWAGWALLAGVATYLFWIRGEERGLRRRLLLARRRLTGRPTAIGALALAIIAGAGGFVFYNTNVLNRYDTDADVQQQRAEYEQRYAKYASLPQPALAGTRLDVDFYPRRNAATVRGTYRLDNRTGTAIDAIHVVANPLVANEVSFDRSSRLTHDDADHGYRIYALGKALQPGESVRMNFEVVFAPRGFTNDGRNGSVLPNGSWFQHRPQHRHGPRQWLPLVGYQDTRELDNAAAREKFGLPKRRAIPALEDVAVRNDPRGHEKIEFEAIVATDEGQIGVAPGVLRRTWTSNGRSYAHYASDAPISNAFAVYSANYAVRRSRWKDVDIEVFHHPTHTENIDRMLRSVQASLDYHTRHYGPYPHKQLRLVEYASSGRGLGLTSYPGMIEYSEGFALVRPVKDGRQIDFPFAVMAHEMGHQWWGHQLVPASVEGAPLLSESLAWYSAMLTVEEAYGREHLQRVLDIMRREYLAPHQTREVSLLRSFDRLDAYRTGPFAFNALRQAVGADRLNAALRNLLAKFDPSRPPYPTSLDLYAELRAVTPPDLHYLLKDLFEEITFWDLKTKKAEVRRADEVYHATIQIEALKLKSNATGKETPVAMNDAIEVAVFDAGGKTIYRRPHRLRSGVQTITVTVPHKPARVAVDPDHVLLDREPEDNMADVRG